MRRSMLSPGQAADCPIPPSSSSTGRGPLSESTPKRSSATLYALHLWFVRQIKTKKKTGSQLPAYWELTLGAERTS